MKLSIVIPVLNEAECIVETLMPLQYLRRKGHEVILVDGGSGDDTAARASGLVDKILHAGRGRAVQMNRGAGNSGGDVLLFLHADTLLPGEVDMLLASAVREGRAWGRFDVRLSGAHILFRIIEWLMNHRSRLTGIATGDQAIFVTARLFRETGGYLEIPLMEDIALCRSLKKLARPLCLKQRVTTSSRRWEEKGIVRTVFIMWSLRLRYLLGADPARLAGDYE